MTVQDQCKINQGRWFWYQSEAGMQFPIKPIHTADAYATELSSWRQSRRVWTNLPTAKLSSVVSAVWTQYAPVGRRQSCPSLQCAVGLLRLVTSDDLMTSLLTRKLCYRKDDRAMRPIGHTWVPWKFSGLLTTPTATIPNIFHGLVFVSTCECSHKIWSP